MNIESLHIAIEKINEQLNPVLSIAPERFDTCSRPIGCVVQTSIGDKLNTINNAITNCIDSLAVLSSRIEL